MQVCLLLRRLRRRDEGEGRGHLGSETHAPRQGACKAPWNPLLTSYVGCLLCSRESKQELCQNQVRKYP